MAPHPCLSDTQASLVYKGFCWSTDGVSNLKKIWADQQPEQISRIEQPTFVAVPRSHDIRRSSWGRYDIWRTPSLVDLSCLQGMTGIPHHVSTTPLDSPFVSTGSDWSFSMESLPSADFEIVNGKLFLPSETNDDSDFSLKCSESSIEDVSLKSSESSDDDVNSSMESDKLLDDIEVPIDSPYMTYTQRSRSRTYEVIVVGKRGDTCFFINFEDLQEKASKLAEQLKSVDGRAPRINVDAYDLEILLRYLCGSYNCEAKWIAIDKFIDVLLKMGDRFAVSTVIRDCKKFVLQSDWFTIDLIVLRKYFEAFESTGLDVFEYKGAASRPIRSHIISGLVCAGRWPEFSSLLDRPFYNAAIEQGFLKRFILTPAAVNLYLRKFFFMYGNEYHQSGEGVNVMNALQAIFPNVRVTIRVGL